MPTWNEIPRLYTQLIGNPITGFNNLGVNQDYNTIKLRQGTQWDWRAYPGAPWTSYGQANSTNKEWECWVIGGTWMSPYNQESYYTGPGNPIYYYMPDIRDEDDFQLFLREIPWNIENYSYDDTTKISTIIVEMIQHGWRFKKRDGSAPIAVDVLLAYDFTDPNCINEGDTTVTDLSNGNGTGHGSGFNGDLNENAALASGTGTYWTNAPGLEFTSGNQWINVPGNLQPSVQNNLTYSVTGWRSGTGSQYLWDARNCSGTWMLTEYSGFDFNNGNSAAFNDNNAYNTPFNYLQTQGAISTTGYYNGTRQFLNNDGTNSTATNETTNIPTGPWGNNFRIGTRYTDSSRWTGVMGGFWIYDKQLTTDEQKIVNAHTWDFGWYQAP